MSFAPPEMILVIYVLVIILPSSWATLLWAEENVQYFVYDVVRISLMTFITVSDSGGR